MKRLAMLALMALWATSCSVSPQAIADVDALAARGADAIWQVESEGCGWRMRGSAFAIDARHLVTNRHVIANDSSPIVRSRGGEERNGKVIGASAHPDVAVIEVSEDLPAYLRWARTSSLAEKEPLVVVGYPSPAYTFKATTGEIVNFQGPGGAREAALVNAPLAVGNSGGPGLRGDTTVAGVVTRMTIPKRPEERVAILFMTDSLRPSVTRFLRAPSKVLSSCGLGPDYVPPVPESYDIEEAPPTAEPIEALPVPSVAPGQTPVAMAAPPTSTPVRQTPAPVTPKPCPSGGAAVEVSELTATQQPDQPSWWRIDARGYVRNYTSASIEITAVDVTVDGDPPITRPAGQYDGLVARGQWTQWVFEDQYVHSPEVQPTRAEATVDWHWPDRPDCPMDRVTGSGPNATPTPGA